MTTLGDFIGHEKEDDFNNFNLTEIQDVLKQLQLTQAIDLPHAEKLQQMALRGADLISEYSCKLVKTIGYLESSLNKLRNKAIVDFAKSTTTKVTADVRKAAGEASDEVEDMSIRLSRAKAAKALLDKKYDILIKSHYYYKDIATGINKTIIGYNKIPNRDSNGWD